jgi:hypothetical protein
MKVAARLGLRQIHSLTMPAARRILSVQRTSRLAMDIAKNSKRDSIRAIAIACIREKAEKGDKKALTELERMAADPRYAFHAEFELRVLERNKIGRLVKRKKIEVKN